MPRELLLLAGGEAAVEAVADVFVPAAGGAEATIALLLQGGEGWRDYVPRYVRPWEARGAGRHTVIVPDGSGELDADRALSVLAEATGIFIGGGSTPTYHRLYAGGPVADAIRKAYRRGVPVVGLSAGAIIAPADCVMTPERTDDGSYRLLRGLGLVDGVVVEVHFSERRALPHLLEAMAVAGAEVGYGIAEGAAAVFADGPFAGTLGRGVRRVIMTDPATRAHRVEQIEQPYRPH